MSIDHCKIPYVLESLPTGSQLIPACSIYPDKDGWIILPPENITNEEEFNNWKDQIYNNSINIGLKK